MKFIAFAVLLVVAVIFAAQFLKMQIAKVPPPPMPAPVFNVAPASDDRILSTRELTVYADTLFPIQYSVHVTLTEILRNVGGNEWT